VSAVLPSPQAVGCVAFVLKGYPRLSETFIAQEILALERRGLEILIVSLRHPTDRAMHPIHKLIRATVLYLPEYLYQEPRRVWRGWRRSRRRSGYRGARRAWLADVRRDPTPNRIRRFGQALVLAAELSDDVAHLHAHFLHTPASVARYAALINGLIWTVSAHAKDIWTLPAWEKRTKLAEARWVVTCTEGGRRHLASFAPCANTVALCYHGIDPENFPTAPLRSSFGDGSDPEHPVILLSVGRAVAKKGYDDLLAALALLPRSLAWRFVHIGGGALGPALVRQAERLGLSQRIEWRGALAQPDVLASYRQADLFVLASKVTEDGDRDGLPNVLIEAQSQRLACVATNVSGIPELIEEDATGLLTPPNDPVALAQALKTLIRDPARRAALGAAGELRVRNFFSTKSGIDALANRFGLRRDNRGDPTLLRCFQPSHEPNPCEREPEVQASDPIHRVLMPDGLANDPRRVSSACASPFTRR
jgi:glycosyltransferase involved in cell wall biosynthesis